jgi:uncharacterized membrane protein YfcA
MEGVVLEILPFLGLVGGFMAGLLGLGGGVIMLPLLAYIGHVPLKLATGTTLVQVILSAATGLYAHYREGIVDLRAGFVLGIAGVGGGFAGSLLSVIVSTGVLQFIFLGVVGLALVLLFSPVKLENEAYRKGDFDMITAIATGCGVGTLTGLLGVGGGFILVPLMIYSLKIPFRVTIGTSLLVILISSMGTIGAKFSVGHIDLRITLLVISASVIGAFLGAYISRRAPVRFLRLAFVLMLVLILLSVGYETFF